MAVLGLMIQRPNQTVAFYARALAERFPRAGFGKTTAYTALRQMAQSKTPRVRCTRNTPGDDLSMDLYEAIPDGHDAFRSWMFRPPSAIPAVRQATTDASSWRVLRTCRSSSAPCAKKKT